MVRPVLPVLLTTRYVGWDIVVFEALNYGLRAMGLRCKRKVV